ncbi:MAG: ABC transporter permease, partial [Geminicoccaceae bacterium]
KSTLIRRATPMTAAERRPDMPHDRRPWFPGWFPAVTLLLFLGPIAAGLIGTLLPAFGYLPSLGGEHLGLGPWRALLATPGLDKAVGLSLLTGAGSTLIAFLITVLLFASGHGTPAFNRAKRAMTPLLAVPHLAMAVGLAFLLAPSGWIIRLISPWPTGFDTPPDIALVQGPYGIALTLGLVIKELPFLLLMTFSALGQVRADDQIRMARSLGYGPVQAWLKVVLPLVYPQIRLPIYAVLAFSLSVVDMAMVLGPTTPPTLAPLVLRWFNDPELTMRFQAAAGAVLQLLIVLGAIACWRLAEGAIARLLRPWLIGGRRGSDGWLARICAWSGLGLLFALAGGSLASLLVWSIAGRWRFPSAWPDGLSLKTWTTQAASLAMPAWTTLAVGTAATAAALVLVIGCLEHESRRQRQPGPGALTLIYIPLLIPQIGFLFGVQVALVRARLDGGWIGLIWSHLLFVLPYVFLALADSYRALDPRYARIAQMLGRSSWSVLFRIKLPMLLRPVLIAAAVGFAVSVAQFLPTQFIGAGRLSTLTTEALSLAAGGNRRVVGLFAIVLAALPLIGFALATLIPAWRFRHRRAMAIGDAA